MMLVGQGLALRLMLINLTAIQRWGGSAVSRLEVGAPSLESFWRVGWVTGHCGSNALPWIVE
jgi:hypothetical protein